MLLDRDGVIRWANPMAARIFDRPVVDMVGEPLPSLFRPGDVNRGVPDLELQSSRTTGHAEHDRWMLRANGSSFWATGATNAIVGDRGGLAGHLKVIRNRTDPRERTVALRNERNALNAGKEEAATRLAMSLRELRSPLSAITHVAEALRTIGAGKDKRLQGAVGILQRQVGLVARLIDELAETLDHEAGPAQFVRRERVVFQRAVVETLATLAEDPADRARVEFMLLPTDVALLIDPGPCTGSSRNCSVTR